MFRPFIKRSPSALDVEFSTYRDVFRFHTTLLAPVYDMNSPCKDYVYCDVYVRLAIKEQQYLLWNLPVVKERNCVR
jgi:hypothetical protein